MGRSVAYYLIELVSMLSKVVRHMTKALCQLVCLSVANDIFIYQLAWHSSHLLASHCFVTLCNYYY